MRTINTYIAQIENSTLYKNLLVYAETEEQATQLAEEHVEFSYPLIEEEIQDAKLASAVGDDDPGPYRVVRVFLEKEGSPPHTNIGVQGVQDEGG